MLLQAAGNRPHYLPPLPMCRLLCIGDKRLPVEVLRQTKDKGGLSWNFTAQTHLVACMLAAHSGLKFTP